MLKNGLSFLRFPDTPGSTEKRISEMEEDVERPESVLYDGTLIPSPLIPLANHLVQVILGIPLSEAIDVHVLFDFFQRDNKALLDNEMFSVYKRKLRESLSDETRLLETRFWTSSGQSSSQDHSRVFASRQSSALGQEYLADYLPRIACETPHTDGHLFYALTQDTAEMFQVDQIILVEKRVETSQFIICSHVSGIRALAPNTTENQTALANEESEDNEHRCVITEMDYAALQLEVSFVKEMIDATLNYDCVKRKRRGNRRRRRLRIQVCVCTVSVELNIRNTGI